MKYSSVMRRTAISLFLILGIGITARTIVAQGVLDKLKKAAEDASKSGQQPKPAAQPAQQPKPATPAPAAAPKPATPNAPQQPAPAATASASLPGSSAKVETQVLVTNDPGSNLTYLVSPHGSHLAAVTSKGSRLVVTHDGVEGPRFDEILSGNANPNRILFNHSGTHYAYIGRNGQEYVVMMDDKEMGRGPLSTGVISQIGFTPGGKHLYYTTSTFDGSRSHFHLVLDGKTEPESNDAIFPLFSPDGEHHAYLLQIKPLAANAFSTLIVDGKPAGYQASPIAYSGDSLHFFSQAQQAAAVSLLVDGKEFLKAQGVRLFTAPVGNAFVTVVSQGVQTQPGGVQFLVIGTQKVAGSECLGAGGISKVYWSDDGKHYAAKCQATQASYLIFADGKKGLEYSNVSDVTFTAAGKPVYMATNNNKNYIVVGDEESNGYATIAQPVVNGALLATVIGVNRVGFIGVSPQNGDMTAIVDNKPVAPRKLVTDLTFSPDGTHFAFASASGLNLDGVDDGSVIAEFQRGIQESGQAFPPGKLLFSPDSKHVFHFGRPSITDPFGVVIDGKFLPVGRGIPAVATFTPDSKHLFWMDREDGSAVIVYLDGKPAAHFEVNQLNTVGWWEMGEDGTLSVIAQDGDAMKRFHITPPPDTSIDTLLAAAKPLPKK